MANAEQVARGEVRDHMPVVGSDGHHIGTVDGIDGDYIRLTRSDPETGGQHRWLKRSTVAGTDGGVVRLSLPAAQAREALLDEAGFARLRAIGGEEAASTGQPDDPHPHGSRAHAHGGPKGQREQGTSGQASGPPGQLSFGVDRKV